MSTEKNIINPDYLSRVTHQIAIGFEETGAIFSTASSFLYNFKDKVYLITNWHNVSGRHPQTGERLSEHAGIPNFFLTYFRKKDGGGVAQQEIIKLYSDEEMLKPKWLIHPQHKEKIDVVAIEIEERKELIYSTINKTKFDDIPPEIGDECFVIGYPFEEFRYLGLPIWKKASIATEPTVNEDQLPKILIDTATRSGLSGSPVIYRRDGIHTKNGFLEDDSIIGVVQGFLGVYSGRIGKDDLQAQLGIVWKKKVIEEIIAGSIFGNIEFQNK